MFTDFWNLLLFPASNKFMELKPEKIRVIDLAGQYCYANMTK